MKFITNILFISIFALLTGCITTNRSTQTYDVSKTGAVLRIHSNYKGIPPLSDLEVWFRDQGTNINSGKIFLRKSGALVFVDLQPGRYELERIDMGNYFIPFTDESHFIVKDGLTYIGDLHIDVKLNLFSIENKGVYIRDGYEDVVNLMLDTYPNALIGHKELMFIEIDKDRFHVVW